MQSRGDTKRRGNAPRTEVIATAQALAHDPVPAPREEIRILEVDHVGKQVAEGDVAPLLEEGERNPRLALRPTRDHPDKMSAFDLAARERDELLNTRGRFLSS